MGALESLPAPRNSPLRSYAEVGAVLGISPARVRQLEQRALGKLRKRLISLGITSASFRVTEEPS